VNCRKGRAEAVCSMPKPSQAGRRCWPRPGALRPANCARLIDSEPSGLRSLRLLLGPRLDPPMEEELQQRQRRQRA